VKPDGTKPVPISQPYFDTGPHGCSVSPDGQFLACEPPGRYSSDGKHALAEHGMRLSLIDGTKPTYIKRTEEKIGLGFVLWSPDSTGVVYYSFSNSGNQGWLVYVHVDREILLHTDDEMEREKKALKYDVLAQDIVPSQFCKGTSGDLASPPRCRSFGTGEKSSAQGSDLPVWSPDSRWVYYSGLMRSAGNALPQRVIGRVLISKPNSFEPLTLQFTGEAGHPAISPNGGAIAFLGTTSTTDPRAQAFLLVVKTRRVRQLTSFPAAEEASPPNWWSWLASKKP
jgi:WD40-like Beta Propeller Repeat